MFNAWQTGPALSNYLASAREAGPVYLAAHSLGNMVACCALLGNPDVVEKYFMLNGAVAAEAFNGALTNTDMLHKNWIPYESLTQLRANEWHTIFNETDPRRSLTWKGVLSPVAGKIVNYYSSGDEVFEPHPKADPPESISWKGYWDVARKGRFSWAYQEKRKGSSYPNRGSDETFSGYAGWRFNDEDPPAGWTTNNPAYDFLTMPQSEEYILIAPAAAEGIAPEALVEKPFFGMGEGDFRENLFTTNTTTVNEWLTEANRWHILAGAIPARSLAAGRAQVDDVMSANVDVNLPPLKPVRWPNRVGDVGTQG